jgi:hypothetical protein
MSINTGKVVVGGLVAGFIMNAVDFVVNGVLLGSRWEAAAIARNIDVAAVGARSLIGWIASDFALGVAILGIYAGIRPRFGPGPKTAAIASLAVWTIAHVAYGSMWFTGLYSPRLVGAAALGSLVGSLAGGYAGCRIYQEAGAPTAARI